MDEDGVYRLEAPSAQKGGLIIKKKNDGDSKSTFKVPEVKKSLLGLDRLAGRLQRVSALLRHNFWICNNLLHHH